MKGKRGKEVYTKEEVWEILEEIREDLKNKTKNFILGENGLTEEDIDIYFENYAL